MSLKEFAKLKQSGVNFEKDVSAPIDVSRTHAGRPRSTTHALATPKDAKKKLISAQKG